VELCSNERAVTKDRHGADLPRYWGHLFADEEGLFPVDLNDWERRVVEAEMGRPGFVAWYRNPGSVTPASVRIAYQDDAGEWASLQPDFIVVSQRDDGTLAASIVDPHGDYLADARAKLHALASFADRFADRFVRGGIHWDGGRRQPSRPRPDRLDRARSGPRVRWREGHRPLRLGVRAAVSVAQPGALARRCAPGSSTNRHVAVSRLRCTERPRIQRRRPETWPGGASPSQIGRVAAG
jgi:hypothetical protein